MRITGARDLGHVVVLGGGVAGLLCARAAAEHAERVTIVERDPADPGPHPRPGVPQSRHTHVLLTSGIRALERLFPGVVDHVADAGGPRVDVPGDVGVWQGGQWVSRTNPSRPVVTASRPLLEHVLRERTASWSRVTWRCSTQATGLLGDPRHVTGVTVQGRGGAPAERIAADLVVDATGRSSRVPRWWAEMGGRAVPEQVLDTGRSYATCVVEADDTAVHHDLRGFYLVPEAGQPIGAIVLPVEGGRWMVTLSGPRGNPPPGDVDGFVDFARELPHDAIRAWLSAARSVGRPWGYRHTANRRRRWDRALRNTRGLLVVGDALCALNPVYGQGLSVAALGAEALRDAAARSGDHARLQRAVWRAGTGAWAVATGADSPMPGAAGDAMRSGSIDRLLDRYVARVRDRVPGDPVVCAAFRDVLFLLAPPSSLLTSPAVVRRALLSAVVPTPRELPTRRPVEATP